MSKLKEAIIGAFLITFTVAFVLYLFAVFISLEPDPRNWLVMGRATYGGVMLVVVSFLTVKGYFYVTQKTP